VQSPTSETCQELIARLSEFLDGELDPVLCEGIERHLATCAYCRTMVNTTRQTLRLYRMARASVPRSVHAHLVQALGSEQVGLFKEEN
jgi:predicted anti-sigma-YlaC factor YlaD